MFLAFFRTHLLFKKHLVLVFANNNALAPSLFFQIFTFRLIKMDSETVEVTVEIASTLKIVQPGSKLSLNYV